MATNHVLRVPLGDERNRHVLLNISQEKPDRLDLQIEGTDGTDPYVGSSETFSFLSDISFHI